MPPSTDCSAARSWGGVRTSDPGPPVSGSSTMLTRGPPLLPASRLADASGSAVAPMEPWGLDTNPAGAPRDVRQLRPMHLLALCTAGGDLCGPTLKACAPAVDDVWTRDPREVRTGGWGAVISCTGCGPQKVRPAVYDADSATDIRTGRPGSRRRRPPAAAPAPARPRDPAARSAGVRRAGRRAAVPARRLGHRRPPRDAPAGRPGHRRGGARDRGVTVRVPGLRHD